MFCWEDFSLKYRENAVVDIVSMKFSRNDFFADLMLLGSNVLVGDGWKKTLAQKRFLMLFNAVGEMLIGHLIGHLTKKHCDMWKVELEGPKCNISASQDGWY